MRLLIYIFLILFSYTYSQTGNVGINTTNPMQQLHLGGNDATMRVCSLDSANDLNNDGIINAPLYADSDGVLSLDLNILLSNPEIDAFDGELASSNVFQNGVLYKTQELYSQTVTVTKEAYLEIKYTLSFEVSSDVDNNKINDSYARLIQNFVLLDYGSRKYGLTSKCYMNSHADGIKSTFYNNAEMYIFLPIGTHTISFYGRVGSDSTSYDTYVNFGLDKDILLMRLY